jgi:hypothetical protein
VREARHWLVVLGEAEGLRWVLENKKMAFTEARCRRAAELRRGDDVVLYVTRGAFHNPTRDEPHLAALMKVRSAATGLDPPLELVDRTFHCQVGLTPVVVLPERKGVNVRPLVRRLRHVKRPEVWGQYFRSSLIELTAHDMRVIGSALREAGRARPS